VKRYRVIVTKDDKSYAKIFLFAKDVEDAIEKAWDRLNPSDKDWGYTAKWVASECKGWDYNK
jgi:hypothetical protein